MANIAIVITWQNDKDMRKWILGQTPFGKVV